MRCGAIGIKNAKKMIGFPINHNVEKIFCFSYNSLIFIRFQLAILSIMFNSHHKKRFTKYLGGWVGDEQA